MLIERVTCPYGCANSVMLESTKTITTGTSNLLLDSVKSQTPTTETVKVYSCSCCGRGFESHQPATGKIVI